MKKLSLLLAMVFCLCAAKVEAYECTLHTGTYELAGSNREGGAIQYRGKVIISPMGSNYEVLWVVGQSQIQKGIGILCGNVLSVAYQNLTSNVEHVGVVSFFLTSDFELQGRWAQMGSKTFGSEFLTWTGY